MNLHTTAMAYETISTCVAIVNNYRSNAWLSCQSLETIVITSSSSILPTVIILLQEEKQYGLTYLLLITDRCLCYYYELDHNSVACSMLLCLMLDLMKLQIHWKKERRKKYQVCFAHWLVPINIQNFWICLSKLNSCVCKCQKQRAFWVQITACCEKKKKEKKRHLVTWLYGQFPQEACYYLCAPCGLSWFSPEQTLQWEVICFLITLTLHSLSHFWLQCVNLGATFLYVRKKWLRKN